MKYVIVGIDPGKNAAIAVLDLSGNLLSTSYSKFVGFEWFVNEIRKNGVPVIIATDKKNLEPANKLGAVFGVRVYSPKRDMSTAKKKSLLWQDKQMSRHEKDALAAAVNAFNAYENKFKQAERVARDKDYENIENVKAMLVKKYSMFETITKKKVGKRA